MILVASSAGPRATVFEAFTLRAAAAADGAGLRALCEGQAPRELAWLAGGTLTPVEFALGAADPGGIGLVALREAGGDPEPVGLLRVCVDAHGVAGEFALLVHAAARGRGLGRLLVQRMLDESRRRALLMVRAAALPDNAPMLALARACGFQLLPAADGSVELVRVLAPGAEASR